MLFIFLQGMLLNSDVLKDEGIYQLLQMLGLDIDAIKVLHEDHLRSSGKNESQQNRGQQRNARGRNRQRWQ